MNGVIKKAKLKDGEIIHTILQQSHKENLAIGFPFSITKITKSELIRKIQRERYYLIFHSEQPVGCVAIRKKKKYWEIGSLSVLPDYQRLGLGGRLLEHAEKSIQKQGSPYATLFTPKYHPTLPSYYRSHGYKIILSVRKNNIIWAKFRKRLD